MKIVRTKYRDGSVIVYTDVHPFIGFNIDLDLVGDDASLLAIVAQRINVLDERANTEMVKRQMYDNVKVNDGA